MGRLFALAVVVVLGYFLYSEGLPWIEQRFEQADLGELRPGEEEKRTAATGDCLAAASNAYDLFVAELAHQDATGGQTDSWGIAFIEVGRQLGAAETACGACLSPACAQAQSAASALRSLVVEVDRAVRQGSGGSTRTGMGAGEKLRRVETLLADARRLAGDQ